MSATPIITLPLPSQLSNGTTADATQVMNDFNTIAAQVNTNGLNVADLSSLIGNVGSVVGTMRNGKMYVSAASGSGTFSADEIIVETALGGSALKVANFNQTCTLVASGAGGMDTGIAPVSTFVALYAIYNITTSTVSILGTLASVSVGNVYTGSHMPAGYTYSALLSVWAVNASSQFVYGAQLDRTFIGANQVAITTSTAVVGQSLSIASFVPVNAKSISGTLLVQGTSTSDSSLVIGSEYAGSSLLGHQGAISYGSSQGYDNYSNLLLITAQTVYYTLSINTGTLGNCSIYINGYTI